MPGYSLIILNLVVLDSFASDILINGVQLSNGINGRVAIYSHGSVVMPHGGTYKPLTVYTDENFSGDSMKMSIHIYYYELDNFNNVIKKKIAPSSKKPTLKVA